MIFDRMRQYILSLPGVVEEWPILPEIPVFRVGGTMFAYGWPLAEPPLLSLRTRIGDDLQVAESGVVNVPWQPRTVREWSTTELDGSIPEDKLRAWVDDAYRKACHVNQSRDRAKRWLHSLNVENLEQYQLRVGPQATAGIAAGNGGGDNGVIALEGTTMKKRIYSFESDDIVVHWDALRCIHVEACIRALPDVFRRDRRPWIDPALGSADAIAAACEGCPTGALHYVRKDGGQEERISGHNEITVSEDGPLFVRGKLRIKDDRGETILEDSRAALCRCGQSKNRPLCDGSHADGGFSASGELTPAALERRDGDEPEPGDLSIQVSDPGPLMIRGSVQIHGENHDACCHVRVGALCCCGKSKNKPFCDGSHAVT